MLTFYLTSLIILLVVQQIIVITELFYLCRRFINNIPYEPGTTLIGEFLKIDKNRFIHTSSVSHYESYSRRWIYGEADHFWICITFGYIGAASILAFIWPIVLPIGMFVWFLFHLRKKNKDK